jgi:hypothetical protein
MDPIQALNILDQATAGLTGNRATHRNILQALEVLRSHVHAAQPGNVPPVAPPHAPGAEHPAGGAKPVAPVAPVK